MSFESLVAGWLDPHFMPAHLPYALLVISMMMRNMVWLRIIAIAAGLLRIVIRAFFLFDPVTVLWESVLVLVNVSQLLIIWWYDKHARFTKEEQLFLNAISPDVSRRTLRRLFNLGSWHTVESGERLTLEGKVADDLMFIVDGVVQIEKSGRIVAVCSRGDFVGEMSFVTGNPANATSVVARPVRYIAFKQKSLKDALRTDIELRRAMESALNRNLTDKLTKSNESRSAIA